MASIKHNSNIFWNYTHQAFQRAITEPNPISGIPPKDCCNRAYFCVTHLETFHCLTHVLRSCGWVGKMYVWQVFIGMSGLKFNFISIYSRKRYLFRYFCALGFAKPQGQVRIFLFGQYASRFSNRLSSPNFLYKTWRFIVNSGELMCLRSIHGFMSLDKIFVLWSEWMACVAWCWRSLLAGFHSLVNGDVFLICLFFPLLSLCFMFLGYY